MESNKIICGNSADVLETIPSGYVHLTVTSPPYDTLRDYQGYRFDRGTFEAVARELFRVTADGGVCVWIVGDATVDGSETLSSLRQALFFREIGWRVHDTMIYAKKSFHNKNKNRYYQVWEYMFVFSKGAPRVFNPIMVKTSYDGANRMSKPMVRGKDGVLRPMKYRIGGKSRMRCNIWEYATGHGKTTRDDFAFEHPAMFPEALARDHILSWSNPGDVVLDPFAGAGTTLKVAAELGRRFIGIDISKRYCEIARKRVERARVPLFSM